MNYSAVVSGPFFLSRPAMFTGEFHRWSNTPEPVSELQRSKVVSSSECSMFAVGDYILLIGCQQYSVPFWRCKNNAVTLLHYDNNEKSLGGLIF